MTRRPVGFTRRRTTASAESSSFGVIYWATEFITTRSMDFSAMLLNSSSERTLILVFGAKRAISRPRTPGAGSARNSVLQASATLAAASASPQA